MAEEEAGAGKAMCQASHTGCPGRRVAPAVTPSTAAITPHSWLAQHAHCYHCDGTALQPACTQQHTQTQRLMR